MQPPPHRQYFTLIDREFYIALYLYIYWLGSGLTKYLLVSITTINMKRRVSLLMTIETIEDVLLMPNTILSFGWKILLIIFIDHKKTCYCDCGGTQLLPLIVVSCSVRDVEE